MTEKEARETYEFFTNQEIRFACACMGGPVCCVKRMTEAMRILGIEEE